MDVGMNSKPLFGQVRSLMLLVGTALLLTACLAQAVPPVTDAAGEVDVSPLPPSRTSEPTEEPDTSTPSPTPTVTMTSTSTPTSTIVPTLPVCSSGALLSKQAYEQDSEGRTLYKLYWACSDNSYVQQIVSGIRAINMSVSPEGSWIAFGGETLQVMDLSGREITTLLEEVPKEGLYDLSWAPDGEYIVYQRHRATANYSPIEVIHVPSGTVSKEFLPGEYEDQIVHATISGIVWLPRGDQILLFGNYTLSLYLIDVVCDDASHLCEASNMREIPRIRRVRRAPAVSPDGTRIATVCFVPDIYSTETTLCILDFNGNVIREFSLEDLGKDYIYNLAWSPDGSRIAFDTSGAIYIFSLSDQSMRRLGVIGSQPVWLP
jgi:WD40 repeat protein